MHLNDLQASSALWGAVNAPESTLRSTIEHMKEEVNVELELAVQCFEHDRPFTNVADELADVVILAAQAANHAGINLSDAVDAKWTIVMGRTMELCPDGIYRHVNKEEPPGATPVAQKEGEAWLETT